MLIFLPVHIVTDKALIKRRPSRAANWQSIAIIDFHFISGQSTCMIEIDDVRTMTFAKLRFWEMAFYVLQSHFIANVFLNGVYNQIVIIYFHVVNILLIYALQTILSRENNGL